MPNLNREFQLERQAVLHQQDGFSTVCFLSTLSKPTGFDLIHGRSGAKAGIITKLTL